MKSLIATKRLTYNTRRLLPGDPFEAKDQHARLLIAIKKARPAEMIVPVIAEGRVESVDAVYVDGTPLPADDLAAVRAEYERVLGKRPFHGWSVETLRAKIAEAQAA